MRKNKAELIFDKWRAELVGKDRSRTAVEGNFDELFSSWHRSKISFNDAHGLLDTAIKAHLPSDSVAKLTFKRLKKSAGIAKNELEFTTEWKANISATAKQVFYSLYDIEGTNPQTEDVKYGNMSAQEYRKQRKYADSHPLLDWTKIEHKPIQEDDFNFDDLTSDESTEDVDVDLGDL